ncbi:hypothetical protein [Streptomyces sp. NPDC127103]|uniref:hypothetical protein n=1 Tax=Streptomyces sp. NPDC127103 TaxID=3347139 RepID=UPI003645F6C1
MDDLTALAEALNGAGGLVYADLRDVLRARPWQCPSCLAGENPVEFAFCPGCGTRKP